MIGGLKIALRTESGMAGGYPAATNHRVVDIGGLEVFYREAGAGHDRTVLLLHGFPTSSHMFRRLIPALADRFHVIAPDLPGFGFSSMPDRSGFSYTFDTLTDVVDRFLARIGQDRYSMYLMDYGAPIGFRLAMRHLARVEALVIQNGNAYEDGLGAFWAPLRAYWAEGTPERREELRSLLTPEATRMQYVHGVRDPSRLDPTAWFLDQALLDRAGNDEIQLDLFSDYRNNITLYPAIHGCFRTHQPPTLIVWGRNDPIFAEAGARAYLRDIPKAELHLLDTGHFALEDKLEEIVPLIRDFLARNLG